VRRLSTTFGPYLERDGVVYTSQRWHCLSLTRPVSVRVTASGPPGTELGLSFVPGSCLTTDSFDEAADSQLVTFDETAEFTVGDCLWRTFIRSKPDTVGEISITIELM